MDLYDWSTVKDRDISNDVKETLCDNWKRILDSVDFELDGLVLDLCCGPVSIGAFYSPVVGYDADPKAIKNLRKNGIKAVVGDFRELPFEDSCFDQSVCFGPPLLPYSKDLTIEKNPDHFKLVYAVTSELVRVTKKSIFLSNPHYVNTFFPDRFEPLVKYADIFYAVLKK